MPSVFSFPAHFQKEPKAARKPPSKRVLYEPSAGSSSIPEKKKQKTESPSKEELKAIVEKQKKKIKTLNRKVTRRTSREKSLSCAIKDLKKLLCANSSEWLECLFAGLSSDLIINHFKNQNRIATGRPFR